MCLVGILLASIWQLRSGKAMVHRPIFLVSGVFWALAVASLGYGFWPLGGEASVLLPLAGCSPVITLILVALFLQEPVDWKKISIGTFSILIGLLVLYTF